MSDNSQINTYIQDVLSRKKTLYVSLGIFMLAFLVVSFQRYTSARQSALRQQALALVEKNTPPPASAVLSDKKDKKIDLRLDGTYACTKEVSNATMSAMLSGGQAYLEKVSSTSAAYIVFDGDCGHVWGSNQVGVRMCGLSQALQSFDVLSFLGGGGVDYRSIVSMMAPPAQRIFASIDLPQQAAPTTQEIEQLLDTCVAASSVDENSFDVPQTVRFQELSTEDVAGSVEGR